MGGDQSSLKSKNTDVLDGNFNPHHPSRNGNPDLRSTPVDMGASGQERENCDIKDTDSNGNKSRESLESPDFGKHRSTLVVVNSIESDEFPVELDPLFIRINQIPTFLPILDQPTKKFPWSTPSPDQSLSKLHRTAGTRIGQLYNGYLKKHTQLIANEQNRLTKRIKAVNADVNSMMKVFTARQRQHASQAHKFGTVPEICRTLLKCQTTLQDALKTAELLNDMLPPDDKLETFVWGSDTDLERSCSLNINVTEEKPISVSRYSS